MMPILFIYSPSLLLQISTADLVIDVSTAIAGVWFVSAAVAGYFARPLGKVDRLACTLAGAMPMYPREVGEG